jgi:hypothetical protein
MSEDTSGKLWLLLTTDKITYLYIAIDNITFPAPIKQGQATCNTLRDISTNGHSLMAQTVRHAANHNTDTSLHSHILFFKMINNQLNLRTDINHVTSEVMEATIRALAES